MKINNHIVLDFNKTKQVDTQTIQCDMNSRFVRVSLRHNNSPIDLSDVRVCIMAVKPDGKEFFNDCTVIDAQNGIAEFEITQQLGMVIGEVECQIKLFGPNQLLSSNIFRLSVRKTLSPSSESSEDQLNTLVNALGELQDIDNRFAQTNAQLSEKTNESYVNAVAFGIKEGFNVNVEENTRLFQELIDYCADDKVIIFPSGEFVFNSVNLGEKRNITIKGASSSFASFAQKNIYTGAFIDEFTKIYCNAPSGETFFNHKSCVLILENIAFYNVKKDSNGNFTQTEAKKNIFMQHTRSEDATKNVEKGKAFCFNTAFYGWKVVFGSDFTFQHLEDEWRTGLVQSEYEYFKQSCVVASRCRFTRNGVAINQSVDGRLVDCSFNKNDYAIVLRENSGFTTISNCRIEWNNYNGIYCDKAHDVTVSNCEFDCNGWAGLYATNNTESNFNGVFRRNGAKIETLEDGSHQNDFTKNVHIYANGNLNCNFIGSNTVVKPISDVASAPERPSNCSNFTNNKNCVVSLNNLAGCTKKDKTNGNRFDGNINCIIDNNILVGRESYPV
jgi:hypothetical protein